jgi:hypothetical protein
MVHKASTVAFRSPLGSLRERQRAARATAPKPAHPQRPRSVKFAPAVDEALTIIADNKGTLPETLAMQIVGGIVLRGSINAALRDFESFRLDHRALSNVSRKARKQRQQSAAKNGA